MRTCTKSLSVLLVLCLLTGCFGAAFTASAASVQSIAVSTAFWAKPGDAFPTAEAYTARADETPLTVSVWVIQELIGDQPGSQEPPFLEGKTYQVSLALQLPSDSTLTFPQNGSSLRCTITINGYEMNLDYMFMSKKICAVAYTFTVTQPKEIDTIWCFMERMPYINDSVLDYDVRAVDWYYDRGVENQVFHTSDTKIFLRGADGSLTEAASDAVYLADTVYVAEWTATPSPGFVFASALTAYLNASDNASGVEVLSSDAGSARLRCEIGKPSPSVLPESAQSWSSDPLPYEIRDGLYVGVYARGNCRWTFDPATGELIFYATGEDAAVPPGRQGFGLHAPYDFLYDVRSVYIGEGIRYIGQGAFVDMIGMRQLTLPASLDQSWYCALSQTLYGLESLETLVVKSDTCNPFFGLIDGAFYFPTIRTGQPIPDVNTKRAVMDVRCALRKWMMGVGGIELDEAALMAGDFTQFNALILAANAKNQANLPLVTSEDDAYGYFTSPAFLELDDSYPYTGQETTVADAGIGNPFLVPPYFRIVCAQGSYALYGWNRLNSNRYFVLDTTQDIRLVCLDNPALSAESREKIQQDLSVCQALGDIRPSFDAAVVDLATYTETMPETYMDRRAADYTVTAVAQTGGTVSGSGKYYANESAELTATPDVGYVFDGWYVGSVKISGSETYSFPVTQDVSFTAKFIQGASVVIRNYTAEKKVDYRATITFTADVRNPVSGAEVQWFVDGKSVGTGAQYTVREATKNVNVQAKYMQGTKTLAESEIETVKVASGFFARLKAFFRALFGRLPVVVQEYLGVEMIERILP